MIPVLTLHVPRKVDLPQQQMNAAATDDYLFAGSSSSSTAQKQPGSAKKGSKNKSFAATTAGRHPQQHAPAQIQPQPQPQPPLAVAEAVKVVEVDFMSTASSIQQQAQKRRKLVGGGQSFNAAAAAHAIDFSDVADSHPGSHSGSVHSYVHNTKLYGQLNAFFEYFWDLEIDNTQANAAFFGKINEFNYLEFGLSHFTHSHVNFPVIKVP
jgi:hypothetical protein